MVHFPASALRAIHRDIARLSQNPPQGIRLCDGAEENLMPSGSGSGFGMGGGGGGGNVQVGVWMKGPEGTAYEGGHFHLLLSLPPTYPASPPSVSFLTKIFHPNVSPQNGEVCINVLKRDWNNNNGNSNNKNVGGGKGMGGVLGEVMVTIKCLLIHPNPSSALDESAGRLLLEDFQQFSNRAKLFTSIHATIKPGVRIRWWGGVGSGSGSSVGMRELRDGEELVRIKKRGKGNGWTVKEFEDEEDEEEEESSKASTSNPSPTSTASSTTASVKPSAPGVTPHDDKEGGNETNEGDEGALASPAGGTNVIGRRERGKDASTVDTIAGKKTCSSTTSSPTTTSFKKLKELDSSRTINVKNVPVVTTAGDTLAEVKNEDGDKDETTTATSKPTHPSNRTKFSTEESSHSISQSIHPTRNRIHTGPKPPLSSSTSSSSNNKSSHLPRSTSTSSLNSSSKNLNSSSSRTSGSVRNRTRSTDGNGNIGGGAGFGIGAGQPVVGRRRGMKRF